MKSFDAGVALKTDSKKKGTFPMPPVLKKLGPGVVLRPKKDIEEAAKNSQVVYDLFSFPANSMPNRIQLPSDHDVESPMHCTVDIPVFHV